MAYFVNKSFEPEMKVKTLGKTLTGAVSRICETKCHSLRKKEIKVDEVFIPRWEDSSYCSLASEWDVFTGLCENWNLKLKQAKPLEGFPGSSAGKESTCNAGNPGSIPGLGRSPGEGNGNPLQYSCLENSMDRGSWWVAIHVVTKSQT